ncbi:hypothetical protein Pcinc_009034 [Petrolisthes cinctipes]|uniref:alpha-1,2-Mannosidase n=1 Tax=Petrolisthes cinctipes TaxID=88211 RepID=A0AAE1KVW1_PETCI|nr:hypothetical protein Pcinc_009034 [Petrolisthes cinctipes]
MNIVSLLPIQAYFIVCFVQAVSHGITDRDIIKLREDVRGMFYHAYDGYMKYAYPYDELRPLTCDGHDTWGSYSLTLVDALDTLAVMGNKTEFQRVVNLILDRANFDVNINVSVFETNIRIIGGLLSGHLMSRKMGVKVEDGWPCDGPLLRMAKDVASRVLPAFDTPTGMPYGTVNLRDGVPEGETPITCTAGVGTYIIEFGTLSRLTGDPVFEQVALRALHAVWQHRSQLNLLGNHIDVLTGRWTAQDSGIGAGVDSFFEYLAKGASLLQRPELMTAFKEARSAVEEYLRHDDWHLWATMTKGYVTMAVFQSLEAYWPGVLTIVGDINSAQRIVHNYHQVWKQYGFTPEFYNIPQSEVPAGREGYPLRPELVESLMYLYQATRDPTFLSMGADIVASIQHSAKTQCGYATVKSVTDHTLENRMESFFLAETTKYLYLLFDRDHWLHNTGQTGTVVKVGQRHCVVESGGYIYNSEAHPVDPGALACCSTKDEDWSLSVEDQVALILNPTKTPWKGKKGHKADTKIKKHLEENDKEMDCGEYPAKNSNNKEDDKVTEVEEEKLESFSAVEQTVEGKFVIIKGKDKLLVIPESPKEETDDTLSDISKDPNSIGEGVVINGQEKEDVEKVVAADNLIENSIKEKLISSDVKYEDEKYEEEIEKVGKSEKKSRVNAQDNSDVSILDKIRKNIRSRILDKEKNAAQSDVMASGEGGSGIIKQKDGPRFGSLSEAAERGQGGNNSGMENSGVTPSVSSSKYGASSSNAPRVLTTENKTPPAPRITPAPSVIKRVFSLPELRQKLAVDLLGYKNLTAASDYSLLSCTHPPFTHMLNFKGQMFSP